MSSARRCSEQAMTTSLKVGMSFMMSSKNFSSSFLSLENILIHNNFEIRRIYLHFGWLSYIFISNISFLHSCKENRCKVSEWIDGRWYPLPCIEVWFQNFHPENESKWAIDVVVVNSQYLTYLGSLFFKAIITSSIPLVWTVGSESDGMIVGRER